MKRCRIAKLDPRHAFSLEAQAMTGSSSPMEEVTLIDQYTLQTVDLNEFNVLSITDFVDQEHLYRHRHIIANFLDQGNIVVANTHIFRSWLPGVGLFIPKKIHHHRDYLMKPAHDNTFYRGVDMMELTYRKGVSGFYARGFHPIVNRESEIILQFSDGTPIVFVDRTASKGTVIAGSCRDFLTYVTGHNSTEKIIPQFFQWLEDELSRLQERV